MLKPFKYLYATAATHTGLWCWLFVPIQQKHRTPDTAPNHTAKDQTSARTRHHHRPDTTTDQTPPKTRRQPKPNITTKARLKVTTKKTPPQTRHNQTYQRRPRTKHHKTCVSKRRPFLLMLITRPPPHHRASASETLNCPLFYPPIQADFMTTNSSVIRHFGKKNQKHLNIERFCDMIKLT